jgi:hypothetical protein
MAGRAEDPQVAEIVRAAFGQRDHMIALPVARLTLDTTQFASTVRSLELDPTVAGILLRLVGLAVRVAGIPGLLVDHRLMQVTVVRLRLPATHDARSDA